MTPYNRKLQSALISAGKKVEANIDKNTPTIPDLKVLFDKFTESGDTATQAKSIAELIAGLVKWQVERV
jgi:hypothetical protein